MKHIFNVEKKEKEKRKSALVVLEILKKKQTVYILPLQILTNFLLLLEVLRFYQNLVFYIYIVVHTLFLFLPSSHCHRCFFQCSTWHEMQGMSPADFLNQMPLVFQLNGIWSMDHSGQMMFSILQQVPAFIPHP